MYWKVGYPMERYQDRQVAGKALAEVLKKYENHNNVIVLGLPRGGVPVAAEVAKRLNAPLDVFIVRKLGVPGHEELAMGAIATGQVIEFNDDILQDLHITKSTVDQVIASEKEELIRREILYRGNRAFPDLKDKIVILVDDGIATGATIRAALKALRKFQPNKIIAAVPVAEKTICQKLSKIADEVVCPLQPTFFYAVGAWYDNFEQTTDNEVRELLGAL